MNGFEGSFGGDAGRIDPATVLECGVCWWVYDPARGDDTWQIPPGTPFAGLPAHWRCPSCDAAQGQFMVLPGGPVEEHAHRRPSVSGERQALRGHQRNLLLAYTAADQRMRSLPVYNERLDIRVIGLRPWHEHLLCIIATPWCMNILLLPGQETTRRMEGTTRDVEFPSGTYSFIAGELEGCGWLVSCSLFSPMEQFDDPEVVAQVAEHALEELLRPPASAAMSRRRFLRGGGKAGDERASAR